jgi:hypothetical protein
VGWGYLLIKLYILCKMSVEGGTRSDRDGKEKGKVGREDGDGVGEGSVSAYKVIYFCV